MVELELCRALRAFIENAVKDLVLPVKGSEEGRTPTVFNGYLPAKKPGERGEDEKKYFPFIVVRPDEGESDQETSSVKISIIFGAYSSDDCGHEQCFNMMTRVRNALMSMPFLTLDGRYQLRDEISWRNYPDQPWPYWQLDMTTNWIFNSPQPVSGVEDL